MSLYHEAAQILSAPAEGGSLKSRVFGRRDLKSAPNQLYALALETCKWSSVLKEVVEGSELLSRERKLTPILSLLLVHDLLLAKGGIGLPQSHGLRASVERHKGRLSSELTLARLRRKVPSLGLLGEQIERASAGEGAHYPRWVRVNALKSDLEEQLDTTFAGYARAGSIQDVVTKAEKHIFIDPHVPGLIGVTPGVDLTKTAAYASGKIILQDKASCFPAYLLDPRSEDGDVIDACAAPGNKTTHLAAILHSHRPEFEAAPQTIYAFEKDSRRAQTLEKMVKVAGSKTMTRIGFGQDFLRVDPQSERFRAVGALLLDPSCSGSGIIGRDSMPELHLPEAPDAVKKAAPSPAGANPRKRKLGEVDGPPESVIRDDDGNETVMRSERDLQGRLGALSAFQLDLLLHAFEFPAAKKVTYSTCSVYSQENEEVVMKALRSDVAQRRGWQMLTREDQVRGMKEWDVRGETEACGGDAEVAEACIRSRKDDGRGVMGFFVAGFVRFGTDGADSAGDGPYLRDDGGGIVRDAAGMPVLRSTGAAVPMIGRDDIPDEESEDGSSDSAEGTDDPDGSRSSGESEDADGDGSEEEDDDDSDENAWNGFEN